MKFRRKPIVVDAVVFRPGMENGIHKQWVEGREPWEGHTAEHPYIMHKYKKIWIDFGDILITEKDGTKYAMTEKEFKKYFEKVTDEVVEFVEWDVIKQRENGG
jgi:hypothetical protein